MIMSKRKGTDSDTAAEVLRKNGRSFNFARAFLTEVQGNRAARLYAFCRYLDDLADKSDDNAHAMTELDRVGRQLNKQEKPSARIADFLQLTDEVGLDLAAVHALIDGVKSDLQTVAFETEEQLLRYAYRVAGTVGLMMCAVLDVRDADAAPFAIDLGVAMQLTNIARDIREDAVNNRRYVPGPWVEGASARDIANAPTELRPHLSSAAQRLINTAETYYESASDGIGRLPARSRFAILIAARVYRQIGVKLMRQGLKVWQGRTVINRVEKIAVAGSAGLEYVASRRLHRRSARHDARLHVSLRGLAGAHMAAS